MPFRDGFGGHSDFARDSGSIKFGSYTGGQQSYKFIKGYKIFEVDKVAQVSFYIGGVVIPEKIRRNLIYQYSLGYWPWSMSVSMDFANSVPLISLNEKGKRVNTAALPARDCVTDFKIEKLLLPVRI